MEKMKWIKKGISALLALNMVLSSVPLPAFAATTDNLCEHHTEHTAECGYREGSAGSACTHEHSEDCYAILDCLHECGTECEQGCTHECTVDNGCITMELDCRHVHGDCGYSEGTAEVPCGHVHNENCGYVEVVYEVLCDCAETDESGNLIHTEGCGYVAAVEGQPCGHTACDDSCGYAPATEGTPCTHVCEVKVNSSHADGGHDETCGYIAEIPGTACDYTCRICAVQNLMDALPDEVTAENADAVADQLSSVDIAKEDLSAEELEQVDFTKYTSASEALGSFQTPAPIPEDEASITSVNITWGEMNFTYTIDAGWTDNETGWVEVESTEDTPVTVTADYQNNDGFDFTGTFTETVTGNITQFVLSLSGQPTQVLNGENIGKVILTIE